MVLPLSAPDADPTPELRAEDFPPNYDQFNRDLLPRVTVDYIRDLIRYSQQAQSKKKWHLVVKFQNRIVELNPQDLVSLIVLAKALRRSGSLEKALEVHLRIRELQCDETKRAKNEGHIKSISERIHRIIEKTLAPV